MSDDLPCDERPYQVRDSRPVTPVIRELQLTPLDAAMSFRPGQYVLLADDDYQVPPRSYSIANMPRPDGSISLLVTLVRGGPTSTWAHELRPGTRVTLSGPYGTFLPDPDATGPVLLLAAGSGMAPARAIAEALLAEPAGRPVTLFFSAGTSADRIDHTRFEHWASTRPGFRYLSTLTRGPHAPNRPHVPDLLPTAVGDLTGWEVFASGPPGFVTGCAATAKALGAEAALVHTEEFFTEELFTEPSPWTGKPPTTNQPGDPR